MVAKDANNDPVVILKKQDNRHEHEDDFMILLMQDKACRYDFKANVCFDNETYTGYWVRKHGIILFHISC